MKAFILIFCLLKIFIGINIRAKNSITSFINVKDRSITIYGLNSKYESALEIPSDKLKYYQIDAYSSGKYSISKGTSVTVNNLGTITPKNITWYWYTDGYGYQTPQPGKTLKRIEKTFYPGISEVTVKVDDKTFKITVTVLEYGEEYAEKIIDSYIKANVTNKKTKLEKFKAITAFPAQFPYNYLYQSYIDMVVLQGGDCWASANTIQHFCEKVGIKSHVRYAAHDFGSGSGHRNVAALIDGKIYIGEAGYGDTNPNRDYNVFEKNIGFSYKTLGSGIVIYQYDGYDENINVPSTIDDKTVTGFLYKCFYIGENWSGIKIKKITLPNTITSLGTETFNNLLNLVEVNIPLSISEIDINVFEGSDNLTRINIDSKNCYFSSEDGVLFDKNKTNLIKFPPGKGINYTGPSSLESIGDYSFKKTKNLEVVKFREKVNYIGSYAFINSNVKEIYFFGDLPKFGEKPFQDLNITFYFPENNPSWESADLTNLGLKESRTFSWTPKEENTKKKSKTALTVVIIIFILLIIGIIAYIIFRKTRAKDSENINSIKGGLLF